MWRKKQGSTKVWLTLADEGSGDDTCPRRTGDALRIAALCNSHIPACAPTMDQRLTCLCSLMLQSFGEQEPDPPGTSEAPESLPGSPTSGGFSRAANIGDKLLSRPPKASISFPTVGEGERVGPKFLHLQGGVGDASWSRSRGG